MRMKLLVVEDDARLAEEIKEYLLSKEITAHWVDRPSKALTLFRSQDFDAALLDIKLPEYDGLELLQALKREDTAFQAIMMSGHGDMKTVIQAMRLGAFDYLLKPFTPSEMEAALLRLDRYLSAVRENISLKKALNEALAEAGSDQLLGDSEKMQEVKAQLDLAAQASSSSVVILGESGTGKELAARRLHEKSGRACGPFIPVNCAAIPASMLEAEFFGFVKGAFTDATLSRMGYFRSADGGTIFLDEIGELPLEMQPKLLRVLETKKVRPLGSDAEFDVDFRLVCATNRSLRERVAQGLFREDLFYRLTVIEIHMPPLRENRQDIPVLVRHFWELLSRKMGRPSEAPPADFVELLQQQLLTGNVRELRNWVERALILGVSTVKLQMSSPSPAAKDEPEDAGGFHLEYHEKRLIQLALEKCSGNHTQAAQLLGITRQALERRLKSLH